MTTQQHDDIGILIDERGIIIKNGKQYISIKLDNPISASIFKSIGRIGQPGGYPDVYSLIKEFAAAYTSYQEISEFKDHSDEQSDLTEDFINNLIADFHAVSGNGQSLPVSDDIISVFQS
jgi:hypothetical protein